MQLLRNLQLFDTAACLQTGQPSHQSSRNSQPHQEADKDTKQSDKTNKADIQKIIAPPP
jgi:hypothetical protein